MPYYAYQQNAKTSMYQQNAKNTYAKYVSIKLLHNCYAMQSIAILCHIIAYQQILWNILAILWHMKIFKHGMVQQIGKSSLLNSQCKIDTVGNGSRAVYFTINATYISIPKLWEDINIVYKPHNKWWKHILIISMHELEIQSDQAWTMNYWKYDITKKKRKFQNSISKTEIFVLEFFPYFEVAYKSMTSL